MRCAIASSAWTLRSLRPRHVEILPAREPGDPRDAHRDGSGAVGRAAKAMSLEAAMHVPRKSDGRRSTDEALEQGRPRSWWVVGGECGGKASDQGERWAAALASDAGPSEVGVTRVARAARCAGSGTTGQGGAVHGAFAPWHGGALAGELFRAQTRGSSGGRWGDVAAVPDGPRRAAGPVA